MTNLKRRSRTPDLLQTTILDLLDERAPTHSICPSEVARRLWPDGWRGHMEDVRLAAAELCRRGLIVATQRGRVIELSSAIGPVRFRRNHSENASAPWAGRLALCCLFKEAPIRFRTTTATSLLRLTPAARLQKLSELCLENATALLESLKFCARHGIGGFRIASTFFPVKTHPLAGYELDELPDVALIRTRLTEAKQFSAEQGIRTSFHPDQFVVINSNRPEVIARSIQDLENHAEMADLVGADVINIHGGGLYGDRSVALDSLQRQIEQLSDAIRSKLTLENDDHIFTPSDLLPVCRSTGIPLVYDVHHHRCLPDGLSIEAATEAALTTWNREPIFHLSSPLDGWDGPRPERHHDYIDPDDFPACWRNLAITIDVEAKAKEKAVLQLLADLKAKLPARSQRTLENHQ